MKCVEVEWRDAQSKSGWAELDEMRRDVTGWHESVQKTVGYELANDEHGIAVVQTVGPKQPDRMAADLLWIPRAMVLKETRR